MTVPRIPERDQLLEAVDQIADVVRENADEAERLRRMPEATVAALDSAGVFKMVRPREVGGYEADPITQPGNLEVIPGSLPMGSAWHLQFLAKNLSITAIIAAVALRYFYVQHQWRSQIQSEAKARIQALQSRIRPHFLFNSMNTIASLTRTSPELAEQVTEDLADLFRASLGDASVPVTLERELEVCRQYLRIEEQRLGARVTTEFKVDELPVDAILPGLILQPLAENAIYHGIEPEELGGFVSIDGDSDEQQIVVRISNSLPISDARSVRRSNQMAQDNVAQRLRAFFGADSSLQVSSDAGEYTVELRFPYLKARP